MVEKERDLLLVLSNLQHFLVQRSSVYCISLKTSIWRDSQIWQLHRSRGGGGGEAANEGTVRVVTF